MSKVDAIPKGYHTLTPSLTVKDSKAAIEFYKKAFNATQTHDLCLGPNGKVMHAEIKIGDSIVMLNDEFPDMHCLSPEGLKGTPVQMYMYVENVDTVYD